MMRKPMFAFVFLGLLLGCGGGMRVTSSYDRAIDFSGFRTFDWMPPDNPRSRDRGGATPELDGQIQQAIEEQLAAKGITRSTTDPDFVVAYLATIRTNMDVTTFSNVFGSREGGTWVNDPSLTEFRQGSIVVAFVAPGTREVSWRGSAEAEMKEETMGDPVAIQQGVAEAVQKILAQYPPQ